MCKSRATHPSLITCNMQCAIWYDGTAQLLSLTRVEITFILALSLLAETMKPLTNEGGEETRVPKENRQRRASENATH